jgi:hypothetical protein
MITNDLFPEIDLPELDPIDVDTKNQDEVSEPTPVDDVADITELPGIDSEEGEQDIRGDVDPLMLHVNMLKENGLLLLPEDYEISLDNVEEAYQLHERGRTEQVYTSIIESMPDQLRDIVVYGLNGGQDIDKMVGLQKIYNALDNYDLSNKDHQIEIVRQYLQFRGNDDYIVQAAIDRLDDTDRLYTEASTRLEQMKQSVQQAKHEMQQKEQIRAQQQLASQQQYHNDVVNYIQTQRWADKSKREIYQYLFNPDNNPLLAVNKIMGNPQHYVQLARFLKENYDPATGLKAPNQTQKEAYQNVKSKLEQALAASSVPSSGQQTKKKVINPQEFEVPFYY